MRWDDAGLCACVCCGGGVWGRHVWRWSPLPACLMHCPTHPRCCPLSRRAPAMHHPSHHCTCCCSAMPASGPCCASRCCQSPGCTATTSALFAHFESRLRRNRASRGQRMEQMNMRQAPRREQTSREGGQAGWLAGRQDERQAGAGIRDERAGRRAPAEAHAVDAQLLLACAGGHDLAAGAHAERIHATRLAPATAPEVAAAGGRGRRQQRLVPIVREVAGAATCCACCRRSGLGRRRRADLSSQAVLSHGVGALAAQHLHPGASPKLLLRCRHHPHTNPATRQCQHPKQTKRNAGITPHLG